MLVCEDVPRLPLNHIKLPAHVLPFELIRKRNEPNKCPEMSACTESKMKANLPIISYYREC